MPDAVVDSTVLIAFGYLDRFDVLAGLFERVWVPEPVRREALRSARFSEVPAIQKAVDASLLLVQQVEEQREPLLEGLGEGERSVIVGALQLDATAVLDERQARGLARQLGAPVVGTVGLLVRARRAGSIPAALPLVLELQARGFRLGPAEIDAARRADEG